MFIKTTAAQIRFLLKRNGAIIPFFILLAMVLFNFISNVLVFQVKDVVEMYHPMKLLLLSWNFRKICGMEHLAIYFRGIFLEQHL